VDPALEQLAGPPQPPVPCLAVVRAQARPERQLVRAGEHIDAVELYDADGTQHPPQVSDVATDSDGRTSAREPERGERESSRTGEGQGLHRREASGDGRMVTGGR